MYESYGELFTTRCYFGYRSLMIAIIILKQKNAVIFLFLSCLLLVKDGRRPVFEWNIVIKSE